FNLRQENAQEMPGDGQMTAKQSSCDGDGLSDDFEFNHLFPLRSRPTPTTTGSTTASSSSSSAHRRPAVARHARRRHVAPTRRRLQGRVDEALPAGIEKAVEILMLMLR